MAYSNNLYDTPVVREITAAIPRLSCSQRKIASYILENIFEVATGGIEELATEVGVSTASVSRFVTCIGHTNFSNFKQALLQAFRPPFAPNVIASEPGIHGAARVSFKNAMAAIKKTKQFLGEENLEQAITLLTEARTVYSMALGNSLPVANIASLCLIPYCKHIQLVEAGGELGLYRLHKISKKDLFLIFSFPRYSVDSVHFTRFVKSCQAKVLAVTDQPSSPLVPLSDCVLYSPSEHSNVAVSLASTVALVEALVAAMADRFPDKFAAFTKFSNQLLPFLHFEYSGYKGPDDK